MEALRELVRSKKPNITDSTVRSYASTLMSLHTRSFPDTEFDPKNFDNAEKILEELKNDSCTSRKTKLCSVILMSDNKMFKDQMDKDILEAELKKEKQEKTEKQIENGLDQEEIKKIFEDLKNEAAFLYKKEHRTIGEMLKIQNYIIMSLLSGIYIPVRRAKDYTDFKIKEIDNNCHNRIENNELVFVSYKTAGCYGEQRIKLPLKLKNILKKWISINPTNWLLFDGNLNQLSSSQITQYLNKIFGKRSSVNALRHAYLEEKFGHTIELNKSISSTMTEMGSSSSMLPVYVLK
jgi:hypothetical protein